ncbi:MAG: ISL3 family transposase [Sutterellaceae bacterium]|nr:ISL3 family transposase [Sutterellaceae bacterium]
MQAIIPESRAKSVADRYFEERYPGYQLAAFHADKGNGRQFFELQPLSDGVTCPHCGQYTTRRNDCRELRIRDWDCLACGEITVIVPKRRFRCPRCGAVVAEETPGWVLPGHRVTKTLAAFSQKALQQNASNKDVGKLTGISWNLIKDLDKERLRVQVPDKPDCSRVRHIAIDEISIHKHHKYATVVMDLDDRRVLWVAEGKRQTDIQPFFDYLKATGCADSIESVSVDMNAGFPSLVRRNCPNANIAYDLFHVMKNFRELVLKEARRFQVAKARREYRQLPFKLRRQEAAVRELEQKLNALRGADWLVITTSEVLKRRRWGIKRLEVLRERNDMFRDLYPLADHLRAIWKTRDPELAERLLNAVVAMLMAIYRQYGFLPAKNFAGMLKRRKVGIITAGLVGLGTNILEGVNNKAKVIKRVAFGFRDFPYFCLKLKAAFLGKSMRSSHRSSGNMLFWNGRGFPLGFHKI